MAWTTPKTWTVGEVLTAADLNTYVRDNLNYLYDRPAFRVYRDSSQTILGNTWEAITYTDERYDFGDCWDVGSADIAVTPRDGVWAFCGGLYLAVDMSTLSYSIARVRISSDLKGAAYPIIVSNAPVNNGANQSLYLNFYTEVMCSEGEEWQMEVNHLFNIAAVYQNVDVEAADDSSAWFAGHWLRPEV